MRGGGGVNNKQHCVAKSGKDSWLSTHEIAMVCYKIEYDTLICE